MKKTEGYPQPFGASRRGRSVNLAVCVPKDVSCELLLYKKGESEPDQVIEMPAEEGIGEVRFLALEDLEETQYEYNYRIDGTVCLDPYVREIAGHKMFGTGWEFNRHQIRGRFLQRGYDWEGDKRPQIPVQDVIAYSLHVRGFTMHSSSRVKHKGTFLGVREKLPYLKELGINQIQCMPVYEFQEDMGSYRNYWGYGTGYYFAPKAAYAAFDDAQTELKDLVKCATKQESKLFWKCRLQKRFFPRLCWNVFVFIFWSIMWMGLW